MIWQHMNLRTRHDADPEKCQSVNRSALAFPHLFASVLHAMLVFQGRLPIDHVCSDSTYQGDVPDLHALGAGGTASSGSRGSDSQLLGRVVLDLGIEPLVRFLAHIPRNIGVFAPGSTPATLDLE